MRWIDAHLHIGEDEGGEKMDREELLGTMDEYDLDRGVVFAFNEVDGIDEGNRKIREAVSGEERLEGLFRVDPDLHGPRDLKQADWASGFKFHPRSQDFGMQEVYEHLQAAGEVDRPALVHTGGWSKRGHPDEVVESAEVHTGTDFVLAHNLKGYYFHAPDEFREKLQGLDNAYLDISLMTTPGGLATLAEDLGADRILFASDYPYGHPLPMKENVRLAPIGEEERERIAWRNAERLFFE
ncbi:MAG: amidohydrolase family protein [Candidatus Nanohaloarchaea archaeon]|nr:amidohydrolase family protein [Candidatus Nanohaloarchaea archaeon]